MSEIDHEFTSEIVCPYCGHEHGDSWEASESGTQQCDGCEKHFMFDSEATRTFTTSKADCLNGSPHNWKPFLGYDGYPNALVIDHKWKVLGSPLGRDVKECERCGWFRC